jgi:hypothetical protein
VAAFTIDAAYIEAPNFMDRPVIPFEQVAEAFPPDRFGFFVALSYSKLNRIRAERVAAAWALGYRLVSYVSSRASTSRTFPMGKNCLILEDNTIQPFVKIGHNVALWSGNHIGHHSGIEDAARHLPTSQRPPGRGQSKRARDGLAASTGCAARLRAARNAPVSRAPKTPQRPHPRSGR